MRVVVQISVPSQVQADEGHAPTSAERRPESGTGFWPPSIWTWVGTEIWTLKRCTVIVKSCKKLSSQPRNFREGHKLFRVVWIPVCCLGSYFQWRSHFQRRDQRLRKQFVGRELNQARCIHLKTSWAEQLVFDCTVERKVVWPEWFDRSIQLRRVCMVSCYRTNHSGHTACLLSSFRPNIIELKFYTTSKGY